MTQPILEARNLRKYFPVDGGLLRPAQRWVRAVDDVSLRLERGESLALVGESGCGKSTLALTLLRLEEPTDGTIWFDGQDVTHARGAQLKAMRRQMQMVFQDPYESLNPLMTIGEIVAEPLVIHGLTRARGERKARVCKALEDAGLKPAGDFLDRRPHELSGGQRQRVVIAAALVLEPSIILADEPVSMLDVSIRAEILNLLAELRRTRQIAVLMITHDLSTVGACADRVAVMYLGRIVEIGPTHEVLQNPQHPYTRALLSVVPVANPRLRRTRIILQGDTPDPVNVPSGCRFHPRCPVAIEQCRHIDPPMVQSGPCHQAACILVCK